MLKDSQLPPVLLLRAATLLISGRIRFVTDVVGTIRHVSGEDFEAYRRVEVVPGNKQPAIPGAILEVTFRFAKYSEELNKRLSLIPIPFIIAQPGFRSKTWFTGRKSGRFKGIYEWDSPQSAERYWNSFPMQLMKMRSDKATLLREIRTVKGLKDPEPNNAIEPTGVKKT